MADGAAHAALELIEQSRETSWDRPTVAGQLFLGRVLTRLLVPYAAQSAEDAAIGDRYLAELEAFLRAQVDADAIDRTGEMPADVIQGLARLGAFGMKIPKEHGGLGLSQMNYNRAIALIASYCGSTAVWLSAHQSIGVPQPLKMFGTDAQKRQYLPRLARGAVSAFALTEPDVGSDPAKMATTATPVDGGAAFLLNGDKLWCTNGPVAELLVVMAKTPDRTIGGKTRQQITAFIVEGNSPGIEVVHRCQFMGIRGIQNGLLRFTNVRVPKENILWGPGRGLKLALMTLNTGRLTLPAACVGAAKLMLRITRRWANERQQWGGPIGRHEAVAAKIGQMASHLFAMEAVTWLTSAWADRGDLDIRIEAAMAKLFCSEAAWAICDDTLQIRGGRGYETADSLKARGEAPIPVERAFRDMRINRIIEGTSEVMHLFIAREALDPHIRRAFDVILPDRRLGQRVSTALRAAVFYAGWYPRQWLPTLGATPAAIPAPLRDHWRFVQAASRRLARTLFHAMLRYQQGLEKRQLVLFRMVEVGVDLFAMAATISRAAWLAGARPPMGSGPHRALQGPGPDGDPVLLADLFCLGARRRIDRRLARPELPDDRAGYRVAQEVLAGRYAWLETGIVE
ncbi:MAG: acyl-CoA dehydrogenase family protein [Candidatus Omnitrophica bacterium]|nr:acyl-CoA dehydrogenase family protein [Candidatus Omnitrophota bacterium]